MGEFPTTYPSIEESLIAWEDLQRLEAATETSSELELVEYTVCAVFGIDGAASDVGELWRFA